MNKVSISVLIHLGFWCSVFLWPILSIEDTSHIQYVINRNWLSTCSLIFIFYINYFVFIDQFFFKKKKVVFYLVNISLVGVLFLTLNNLLELDLFSPNVNGVRIREIRVISVSSIQLILPMILAIGMCLGLKMNTKWASNELLLQKVKQTQLDAEIKYLKYQVQPHFLFNTLNNIYSLIDSSPVDAKASIHSLSKMMRYLLHDSAANYVPLTKEIEFLKRYIDLMQLRVSSNVTIERSFPILNQPITIAPLVLISFIENAFKHGVDATKPSQISIHLNIDANFLDYTVVNSFFPKSNEISDSGIGLENLEKRLKLVYPKKFKLSHEKKNNVYTATLRLSI